MNLWLRKQFEQSYQETELFEQSLEEITPGTTTEGLLRLIPLLALLTLIISGLWLIDNPLDNGPPTERLNIIERFRL